MSSFKVEVVEVGKLGKHPNADTLSITHVYDYPVIIRTGDLQEGDKAIYIPVDAIVPTDRPAFEFLGKHNRIKAKRLRGIFSMGLLVKADSDMIVGEDVAEKIGIKKWEEPEEVHGITGGECEANPGIPKYTDIENYRRYPTVFSETDDIIVTEKIHGCNARFAWMNDRLYCGSHHTMKKLDENNMWWKVAKKYDLENKLKNYPDKVFYGEIYGQVQDLKYDAKPNELLLRFFDVLDLHSQQYLTFDRAKEIVEYLGLEFVPILYQGSFNVEILTTLSDGQSTIASNIREGIVFKPRMAEEFNAILGGRKILKLVGENYLTRKGGSERH